MAIIINKFALLFLASSVVSMAFALKSSRDLTVCDTLKACFLVDIDTRKETELTGMDEFVLDPSNTLGYSIRCDVNGKDDLDFIKYMYNGITFDEFGEPRYMAGDSDQGAYINAADYLSTCGMKTIKVQGNVWSNPCFEFDYVIDVSNCDGTPCAGEGTKSPIKSPTPAPVMKGTMAPVPVPVPVSVLVTTNVTVTVPVPVTAAANVTATVPAPVVATANVTVTIPAPMKPDCPPGHYWILGFCKPIPTCPSGQYWLKDCCVPIPKCPSGQYWVLGLCKPIPTCPSGQVFIDGCCKSSCKNEYICPINSSRIAHRDCYDNFHDCECRYGYYKAALDDKCVKYSWCYW